MMKKRFVAMILTIAMTITFVPSALAIENNNRESRHQQITGLFSDLMSYNAQKIIDGDQSDIVDSNELEIESQLADLGVEVMDISEVHEMFSSTSTYSPYVSVPSSTDDIRWYSFTDSETVDGTTYVVQHVSAIARNDSSQLAFSDAAYEIYENKSYILSAVEDFALVYVQKAIGLIPIVQWLPYEFFFVDAETSTRASATFTGLTSAAFSFVKISGQDDNYQTLSLSSNYINFAGQINATGVYYNSPYVRSQEFDYSGGENFCSTSAAITAYRNNRHDTSFIESVGMKFAYHEDLPQYSCEIPVPTFTYMSEIDF